MTRTCLLKLILVGLAFAVKTMASDPLPVEFALPPMESRPKIWWFWGESVTTDQGITQDLEAMKRAGFGGVVVYEQVFSDPPDALKSLSPEWLARFRFAASECARLGMSLEVNASGGFVAGGPWITPELAMQRLVGSDTVIDGGRRVEVTLPQPPTRLDYYRDVAVLAYPTPAGGDVPNAPVPVRSSSVAGLDLGKLFDTQQPTRVRIAPPPGGAPALVQLDYGRPFTARAISYIQRPNAKALVIATQVASSWDDNFYGENMRLNPPLGQLEASTDGEVWQRVCDLPATGYQHDSWHQRTISYPATTARFFRLNLHGWGRNARAKDDDLMIGGIELHGSARIHQWEPKSGNVADFSDLDRTPAYSGDEVIDPAQVIDLTAQLDSAGKLIWNAPPGRWTILRLGHTPTGARIKHARPEVAGLECDKLAAEAVRVQFKHYVGALLREVQQVPGAKLAGVSIDSNEHGAQNWTPRFAEQFRQRRGYELIRFLPAMLGRVVASREASDRFLFDVRRTIADLMSEEYFGAFQRLAHARGMTTSAQAPGIATCLTTDNLQAKGRTDIPMGEFWMTQADGTMDCKEASSAAHTYGLRVAAAEAFTGSRADVHPGLMKPLADAQLALGINQFVVLAYVHQPWDDRKPGVTEPNFYLPYQRHNTWWEDSAGFWHSIARSSHLLRQGRAVSDLLYHLGSDTPLKIATWRMRPVPPRGYDYDVCNDEVLLTRVAMKKGRLMLPDDTSYSALVLAGGDSLTLAAARKLQALVNEGAVVIGNVKPVRSPSLADGAAANDEVRRIADELWGPGNLAARGSKRTGQGLMIWGESPEAVLAGLNLPPDFETRPAGARLDVLYAHRTTTDREIYFVANHRAKPVRSQATFRVAGRIPQLWSPQTGTITQPLAWKATADGRTEVTLLLEAHDSVFVVFDTKPAPLALAPIAQALVCERPIVQALDGAWSVAFSPGRAGPARAEFPALVPWNTSTEPGIRYYSGTAVYRKTFEFRRAATDATVALDLGEVGVLAAVKLNGHDLGVAWKAPFAFDVSAAIREGVNELEVRVVNTWMNRLIRDSALPAAERVTWTTDNPYRTTDPLQKSGLLGPVVLRGGAR
jgi:hypothetical protein